MGERGEVEVGEGNRDVMFAVVCLAIITIIVIVIAITGGAGVESSKCSSRWLWFSVDVIFEAELAIGKYWQ